MNYFERFKQLADEIQANKEISPEEANAILDYIWHLKQPLVDIVQIAARFSPVPKEEQPYDPMRD